MYDKTKGTTKMADTDVMITVNIKLTRQGNVHVGIDKHRDCVDAAVNFLVAGALAEAQRVILSSRNIEPLPIR